MRNGTRRQVTLAIVRVSIASMASSRLLALLTIEIVGLLVQPRDQCFDAAAAQGRGEIRAPRRQLADRAGKIDVTNLPACVVVVQRVGDGGLVAIGLDDLGSHQRGMRDALLAENLEPLTGEPIELAGVVGGDIAGKGLPGAPLLVR